MTSVRSARVGIHASAVLPSLAIVVVRGRVSCRETPKFHDKAGSAGRSWLFRVAKICRESKVFRDDIRDREAAPCWLVTLASLPTTRT
jgi:hypothetical protein